MSSDVDVRNPQVPDDPPKDDVVGTPEPPDDDGDADAEDDGAFAYFTLEGDHFEVPGLPVGNASEVGTFRDALLEMARIAWLRDNPDRQRVPPHFERNLDIRLISIEQGSSRLKMRLHRRSEQTEVEWEPLRTAYSEGRDDLTTALDLFTNSGHLPADFPPKALKHVKNIGATLENDERIVFGSPTDESRRATLDRSTRDLLRQIDDVLPPPAPVTASLTGVLTEFDGHEGSFQIRTAAGLHTCRLEASNREIAERVHELVALDGVTAPDAKVTGETQDSTARRVLLFNVREIQVVRSLAEKAVVQRLKLIEGLQPGWDGPDSRVPQSDVLQRVEDVASTISSLGLPVTIVPNADGAVVLEWRRGPYEYTAAVEVDSAMYLHADNVETDEDLEYEGPYDREALITFLQAGGLP